jgi:hypothetical protein
MEEAQKTRRPTLTPEQLAERESLRKRKKIEKDRKYRARLKRERQGGTEKLKELEDKISSQQLIIQRQAQQLVELYAQLKKKE